MTKLPRIHLDTRLRGLRPALSRRQNASIERALPRAAQLERGQSLVEMAIGMVVVLIILLGLLDLGRAYFLYVALEDAASEAALYLSLYPECPEDPAPEAEGDACDAPRNARYRALTSGGDNVNLELAEFEYDVPNPVGVGMHVSVTIRYPFELMNPIISGITQNTPLMLTVSASSNALTETEAEA